jgi:exopolyphosphatase/guanosine-5'-triphosphate,3'-diphosphate pyrophosphatase
MKRHAVIDIGTNSVKLLVGDVASQHVVPVCEDSEQTRLGRGFYETHVLQADAIAQTAEAVAKFSIEARRLGAASIRVIATSAARDATNAAELVNAIKKSSGLEVVIISGEQEADWAFQGVISDPELALHPLLILDVGGGSTEFILGESGHSHFRESFQLGTVRLLERFPVSDPPQNSELEHCRAWLRNFIRENVAPKLRPVMAHCEERTVQLVGTGGTSTILSRIANKMNDFDRDRIEATRLRRDKVHDLTGQLWSLNLDERRTIAGLPPKRADVILFGSAIFDVVMEEFSFAEMRPSMRGLRYAALMAAAQREPGG